MLASSFKTGTIVLGVFAFGFGGYSHMPAAPLPERNIYGEVDKLALAQEEIDRLCAFTDMKDKSDREDKIPSIDNDEGTYHQQSLRCRDAKHAYIAIQKERRKQHKAMKGAEAETKAEQVDPYSFDHAMDLVRRYCVFPDITHDSFKNRYIPLLNELGKYDIFELEKMCQSAKLQAIGIRDGTITAPESESAEKGYGKEYRPPIRPDFSKGPLDLK